MNNQQFEEEITELLKCSEDAAHEATETPVQEAQEEKKPPMRDAIHKALNVGATAVGIIGSGIDAAKNLQYRHTPLQMVNANEPKPQH